MYSVKYKYEQNEEHEFIASKDLIALRAKGFLHPNYILSDAGLSPDGNSIFLHHFYPEAGVGVYRITTEEPTVYREKVKTIIRKEAHPSLAYVGTVYQDKKSGLYQLYTGNVFLQLESDSSSAVLTFILDKYGLEVKNQGKLSFAPLCYFLCVRDEVTIGRDIFN